MKTPKTLEELELLEALAQMAGQYLRHVYHSKEVLFDDNMTAGQDCLSLLEGYGIADTPHPGSDIIYWERLDALRKEFS